MALTDQIFARIHKLQDYSSTADIFCPSVNSLLVNPTQENNSFQLHYAIEAKFELTNKESKLYAQKDREHL